MSCVFVLLLLLFLSVEDDFLFIIEADNMFEFSPAALLKELTIIVLNPTVKTIEIDGY